MDSRNLNCGSRIADCGRRFVTYRSLAASYLLLLLLLLLPASCFAQGRLYDGSAPLYSPRPELGPSGSGLPAALRDVKIEQRLNESVPLDLKFNDETGRPVELRQYINGTKPVILSLVFYKCPMLCNQILTGLLGSLRSQSFDVGKEFDVVTVSFDPRETSELAAEKKQSFIERYNRPGAAAGWHFLTGDQENIKRLTDSVGFYYNYDAATNQFAHASGIMVLTPEGKLSRYFYGIEYNPRDLRLGLIEASGNKIGSAVDQLLLYCYHYDPKSGTYGLAVIRTMQIGGIITVIGMGLLLFVLRRKERKTNRALAAKLSEGGVA